MAYKNEFPDLKNNCETLPVEKNGVQNGMAGIIQIFKKKIHQLKVRMDIHYMLISVVNCWKYWQLQISSFYFFIFSELLSNEYKYVIKLRKTSNLGFAAPLHYHRPLPL